MKITVNIETTDPSDLIRVANALAGVMPDPLAGAAEKPKTSRTAKAEAPAPQATASTGFEGGSAPAPAQAAPAPVQSVPAESEATPITDADLTAAANAAAAKLGPSGPTSLKTWIANTFQKADGSAGTLKLTKPEQRPALLKGLQEIAQGVKAI